jgi:hypothetical protein
MNKGNCICCGENQTKIGWTYCDSCISDFEDDDDDSFDQEQNEERRIEEVLSNCTCGAL